MSWIDEFPALGPVAPELRERLAREARVVEVPAGTTVFGPGREPDNLLLVLSGSVRVQQLSAGGRQIVLYRVTAGESCVMTTACLMAHEPYSAEAVTETDCRAVLVPRALFDTALARSEPFRRFVFESYAHRLTALFKLLDEVAFQRVDIRLAHRLLALAGAGDSLKATHQSLAEEIGTAREVVSRQLQELQRRGLIELGRGAVGIRDREALRQLAGD